MVRTAAGIWLAVAALAGAQDPPQDVVSAADAAAHVGKTRIVCADVTAVRRDSGDTILDLAGPAASAVRIVVTSRARQLFVPAFETAALRWNVCGRGKIEKKDDGLRVKIDDGLMLRAIERRPAGRAGFADGVPSASGPGIAPPQVVQRPNPKYAPNAMKAKIQGDIEMEGVLQADGTIGDVRVVRSLDALFGLDVEAVKTFKQWRLTPATRNGQPIPVVLTVEMSFRLH